MKASARWCVGYEVMWTVMKAGNPIAEIKVHVMLDTTTIPVEYGHAEMIGVAVGMSRASVDEYYKTRDDRDDLSEACSAVRLVPTDNQLMVTWG